MAALRSDRAQSTVLGLFLILTFLLFALPVLSFGMVSGWVLVSQRAADAAVLAGAQQVTISKQVDARGAVYCEQVAVDPATAAPAAKTYWTDDTASVPLTTASFTATAKGATLTVEVAVTAPPLAFALFGKPDLAWSVASSATAVLPPGGPPAC